MSDCSTKQTEHAVVISETHIVDDWEAYPSIICVGKGDTVAFYIKSHLTTNETVTVCPQITELFSSADLSTRRNNVLVTTVSGKKDSTTAVSVNSCSKPKKEELLLPILTVIVRR